jgi:protein Mpv17
MGFDLQRRRFFRIINSKYIYGRVVSPPTAAEIEMWKLREHETGANSTNQPLVHAVIFLIEMAMVTRLVTKFNSYYGERPGKHRSVSSRRSASNGLIVLTMMITNAILGGIADTVAQSITAIRLAALRKPGGITKDDSIAIEIHELDRKNPVNTQELIPDSKFLPPPFDFERLTRFMGYGFMMAPVQFKWFQFLSRSFPMDPKSGSLGVSLKRVAFDQLIFSPVGMYIDG